VNNEDIDIIGYCRVECVETHNLWNFFTRIMWL
jgi:hypothetical protein